MPPNPPPQMRLTPLTVCAARLLALPVFRTLEPQPPAAELLRRFASSVTQLESEAPPPRLDAFLSARLAIADSYYQTLSNDERKPLVKPMQNLRQALNVTLCAACAGPGGHVCDGQDPRKDQAQVTRVGLCIQLIRDMHDHIVPALRQLVSARVYPAQRGDINTLPYAWGTEWPGPPTRIGPSPEPKVGACTEFRDALPDRHAEVRLSLASDELDWPSLLMVPWVFAHEFVCHVLQIPADAGKPRPRCRLACPFYEGWMDEVAFQLFQHEIVPALDPARWPFVLQNRQGLLNGAYQHRDWRYDRAPGVSPKQQTPQWTQGAEAALAVLEFFRSVVPTPPDALRQLVNLSFQIGAAATSTEHLDHAVYGCTAAAALALTGGEPRQGRLLAFLTAPIYDMSNWLKVLKALS